MEYYSAINRKIFESVVMRWMNLEPIIQSEVSQKEKDKYHILIHVKNLSAMQEMPVDMGLTPGSGRSPGGGNGNPL